MSFDYPTPSWAGVPTACLPNNNNHHNHHNNTWRLLEIKNGVELARHDLSHRACTVLGRAADQVHIVTPHASCSRRHARIAFCAQTGTPWLRDLGSTHGTTVNKRKLPPQACGPELPASTTTPGSRGVVLFPGDVLQLGASTRLFCFEGPASYERGCGVQPQQPQLPATTTTPASTSSSHSPAQAMSTTAGGGEDETTGNRDDDDDDDPTASHPSQPSFVSWGMDMSDDDDDDNDDLAPAAAEHETILLESAGIPEKHRKALESIQALRYKLSNLQTESERIRAKEGTTDGGGLTTGQEKQLQRNATRIKEIQEKIKEKERDLQRMVKPNAAADKKKEKEQSSHRMEDDVDDRTKDPTDTGLELDPDGETEESLKRKWTDARARRLQVLNALDAANQKADELSARLTQLEAAAGDEDAFFLQNDQSLAAETCTKLTAQLQKLDKYLRETASLLKVANPRLVIDLETGSVGEKLSNFMAPPQPTPPPSRITSTASTDVDMGEKGLMLPPPQANQSIRPVSQQAGDDDMSNSSTRMPGNNLAFMAPPPPTKRIRVVGPQKMIVPSQSSSGHDKPSSSALLSRGDMDRKVASSRSTLAALSSVASSAATTLRNSRADGSSISFTNKKTPPTVPSGNANNTGKAMQQDRTKADVWQAPKDQDGSGRSKLNDKFAGRY